MSTPSPLGQVISLGLTLAISGAALGASARRKRVIQRVIILALTLGLMLVALGCFIASFWIWLLPRAGVAGAPLIVAISLLILCFLSLAYGQRNRRVAAQVSIEETDQSAAEILRHFQENKISILIASFLSGVAAAHEPR